jgi:hypothetical protein
MLLVWLDLRVFIFSDMCFFSLFYWFSARSNKNSLYCSFCYLFDTSHFFFLLRKKTPMTNIPSSPKTTGKMLASKFPISKTAAITIKIIPTNSAIFWNIILHILISSRTLYRLSIKRARICLARVRVIFLSIMGVLSPAVSAEFLRYVYRFLAFFAFV